MKRRCFFRRGLLSIQDSVGGRKQYFVVRQVRRRRMRFSGSRISFICGLVWCKASSLLCRELVFEEALRSVCPFASVCCSSVGISTSKRNAPSLQAPRAETRLTVYRALRSFPKKAHALLKWICPAVVPIKCFSSTEKAISVCTSHVILSWKANAPFQVREPPAEPQKLRYLSPEGTFPKNLSILPTLAPAVLELQNFPGPLAFRITIYMVLAPAGQLFIKIWPQGREIFKILCKKNWKMRMHFWSEFAPLLCQ